MEPDSPNSLSLASCTASASSRNGITATTGPKTSSRQMRWSTESASTTVGGNQKPLPTGALPVNATSTSSTNPWTVVRCSAEMSGPISLDLSAGSSTLMPFTAGSSSETNSSYADCSTRILERAQQSWPAL